MKNLVLRYGLYSGAVGIVLMWWMAFRIKQNGMEGNGELFGYAGMVLSMLFVYVGVRVYRDRECGGSISFGQAFKVGGLIALVSCLCYVASWMLVYEFVLPDFMEQYAAHYLGKMKAEGIAEAEIAKASEQIGQYKAIFANPFLRAGMTFIEPLPIALLMSLISAFLLKKV